MSPRARFTIALVGAAATVAFVVLALQVGADGAAAFERRVTESIHARQDPLWHAFFTQFSWFGQGDVLTVATLAVIVPLLVRRQWRRAFLWWFSQGGGATLNYALKVTFGRARPEYADQALVDAGSLSFPSGHTMMTLVFAGFGLFLYLRSPRPAAPRAAAVVTAGIWCGLMGFSRLYLGNHYLSDVFGGYLAGIAWLALCILIDQAIRD